MRPPVAADARWLRGRPLVGWPLAVLVCSTAIVGACTGAGPPAGGSDAPAAEISLLVFGEPEEIRASRELIAGFSVRAPEIDVTLIEASDRTDLLARLATSFAGGQPPDLFLINYRFFGQFAARDVLEPLGSRLDESGTLAVDDFYPQAVDAFRFRGELICLPQNISSLVVYFNRDLFAEAGVSEPRAGWRWDEMVDSARSLTWDTDGDRRPDVHGLGVEGSMIRLAPFVWSNDGELFDDADEPTTFALNGYPTIEAMQKFFDLGRIQRVIPTEEEVEAEGLEARFLNGRLAMLLSSRRSTPTFRTITDFDWDVVSLPVHKHPAGILHSDAYCMTRASEAKDAAWRFVEFALGVEGQRITAATGRTVPSLIEVANSPAFLDPDAKPANSQVFLDGIPFIRRVPNISTWPEIEDAIGPILEDGLYERLSASAAARLIVEETADLFARAER